MDAFDYYFFKSNESKRFEHLVSAFHHESDVTKIAVIKIVNYLVRLFCFSGCELFHISHSLWNRWSLRKTSMSEWDCSTILLLLASIGYLRINLSRPCAPSSILTWQADDSSFVSVKVSSPSKQLLAEINEYRGLLLRSRTEYENMLKIKNRVRPSAWPSVVALMAFVLRSLSTLSLTTRHCRTRCVWSSLSVLFRTSAWRWRCRT